MQFQSTVFYFQRKTRFRNESRDPKKNDARLRTKLLHAFFEFYTSFMNQILYLWRLSFVQHTSFGRSRNRPRSPFFLLNDKLII